ncbi:MAG: hypothetical protein ACI83H_002262 [Glaciecola sp.]|jgi:hypothetical protein
MKNIVTLIVLIFITTNVSSQIGATKSKIIEDHKNYTMEITNDGTDYISFVVEYENYNQNVSCYLTKKEENKEQLCYRVLMIEPSSETNNWIKYFNEQNYVKLDGMIWKDYEHSIVYKVVVEEGSCLVIKYYDKEL